MKNTDVIKYYDYTVPFYKLFWHKGTNAIHYGFWDKSTKSHTDALVNTNRTLAEIVKPDRSSKILDAGCGVGGSSIWLAKNFEAHVVGITISPKQKKKAEKYARRSGVLYLTEFYLQDYLHTEFADSTFDIVWGLESVCYAEDKNDFIREAYRLLKPGGKIIVADGFLDRQPKSETEENVYATFLRGFVLPNLSTVDNFRKGLAGVGFKDIRMFNKTLEIEKTSQYMYALSARWFGVHKMARALRIIPQFIIDNIYTGLVQRDFFKGIGKYYVFYAEK